MLIVHKFALAKCCLESAQLASCLACSASEQIIFYISTIEMLQGIMGPWSCIDITCVLKQGNVFAPTSQGESLLNRSNVLFVSSAQMFSMLPFTINLSGEHWQFITSTDLWNRRKQILLKTLARLLRGHVTGPGKFWSCAQGVVWAVQPAITTQPTRVCKPLCTTWHV